MLAPNPRFTNARGGEGPSYRHQPWRSASEYQLRYENSDDEVQVLSGLLGNDDDDESEEEMEYVKKAIVGL